MTLSLEAQDMEDFKQFALLMGLGRRAGSVHWSVFQRWYQHWVSAGTP